MTTKKISIIAIIALVILITSVLYFSKMADNKKLTPSTDTNAIPDNMAISDEMGG